jgi:hypothetical protein
MQAAGTSEVFVPSFHTTHISACLRALICVVCAVEQLIALLATVTYFYARAFVTVTNVTCRRLRN